MKIRLSNEDADRLREMGLEILRDAMKLREYAYESHVLDQSQWRAK